MDPRDPVGSVDTVPALVTLHVWGVGVRQMPSAIAAVATGRRAVGRSADLTFHKLLGTGDGRTLTARDADPRHWALLTCWGDERAVPAFERSEVVRRWDARAARSGADGERLRVVMRPLASRGRWAGREPFGRPDPSVADGYDGPVAALTRARLRPRQARAFWRSVPPVSARLAGSEGLLLSLGIGEAPVGLQGTFSVWRHAEALRAFAHGSVEHRAVVERTRELQWYAEELFARLAVLDAAGSLGGRTLAIP